MENRFKGELTYDKLRKILYEKFEEKGLDVRSPSLGYLVEELIQEGCTENFFHIYNKENPYEVESYIKLSKNEIFEIIKEYAEKNGFELNNIEFREIIEVEYSFKQDLSIEKPQNNYESAEETIISQPISYYDMKEVVKEYFKENKNIVFDEYLRTDDFKKNIYKNDSEITLKYWRVKTPFGNAEFDLKIDEIINILKGKLLKGNYALEDINFYTYNDNPTMYIRKVREKVMEEPIKENEEKIKTPETIMINVPETKPKEKEVEADYLRLIAAQNEAGRRLKIKSLENVINEEKSKKNLMAGLFGLSVAGFLAAIVHANLDVNQMVDLNIKALGSIDYFIQYMKTITPATYLTILASCHTYNQFLKSSRKLKHAKQEKNDMIDNDPTKFMSDVESQAKSR